VNFEINALPLRLSRFSEFHASPATRITLRNTRVLFDWKVGSGFVKSSVPFLSSVISSIFSLARASPLETTYQDFHMFPNIKLQPYLYGEPEILTGLRNMQNKPVIQGTPK